MYVYLYDINQYIQPAMKYNIKFSPEQRKNKSGELIIDNVPLTIDVRFASKHNWFSTGYRINRVDWINKTNGDWNFDKEEVRKSKTVKEGKNDVKYSEANERLRLIKHEIGNLFKGVPTRADIVDTLNLCCKKATKTRATVMEFYPMFDEYAKEVKFSSWRKKHINVTINHWKAFDKKINFEAIDSNKLKAFEKFLRYDNKGNIVRSNNTIHTLMNITRAFWNYSRAIFKENNKPLHYPFEAYEIPGEAYGTPIGLTIEERDRIYNADIKSKKLDQVRDVFVFQCLTGMRVGDMYQLTRDNIRDGWLYYIARKTKEGRPDTRKIKLNNKALAILKKYEGEIYNNNAPLPFITDQKYNDYLKELAKLDSIKLDRVVTRPNPKTSEPESVKICDIISSHMARRTTAGTLYSKNVDTDQIAYVLGHIPGSKATYRYRTVTDDLIEQSMNKID